MLTIHILDAENHTLQLNMKYFWRWAYVSEKYQAKDTTIK